MSPSRPFAAPTYLVAFTLLVLPLMDEVMKMVPFRMADPHWRFGAFGVMSNALLLSSIGLLLAFLATTVFDHPRFRRVLGILTGVAAVVISGAWIVFALDALQLRNEVAPAKALLFKVAIMAASLKSLIGVITLSSLTLASFRMPRVASSSKPSRGMFVSGRLTPGAAPTSNREVAAPAEPTA